jgi:hypothetical protein
LDPLLVLPHARAESTGDAEGESDAPEHDVEHDVVARGRDAR